MMYSGLPQTTVSDTSQRKKHIDTLDMHSCFVHNEQYELSIRK